MKKYFVLLLATLMLVTPTITYAAKTTKTTKKEETVKVEKETYKEPAKVYMFRGEGCGFCAKALAFFEEIKEKYDFELITYEVWYDEDNKKLMDKVAAGFGDDVSGVPYIIIGDKTFQGYIEDYNDGIIEAIRKEGKNENANDKAGEIINGKEEKNNQVVIVIVSLAVVAGIVALVVVGRKSAKEE